MLVELVVGYMEVGVALWLLAWFKARGFEIVCPPAWTILFWPVYCWIGLVFVTVATVLAVFNRIETGEWE